MKSKVVLTTNKISQEKKIRLLVHFGFVHTIHLLFWLFMKFSADHSNIRGLQWRTAVITHMKVIGKGPRKCKGKTRVFCWAPKCRIALRTWSGGTGLTVGWWSWPLRSSVSTESCSKRTPDSSRQLKSNYFSHKIIHRTRFFKIKTILG